MSRFDDLFTRPLECATNPGTMWWDELNMKREWTTTAPTSRHDIGIYGVELEGGYIYLVRASQDSDNIRVFWIMGGPFPMEKAIRWYGPVLSKELVAGLPKPPKRLSKSDPNKYLGRMFTKEGGAIEYAQTSPSLGSFVHAAVLGRSLARPLVKLDQIVYAQRRYAQQDKDGYWHEVDASDDPRASDIP